MGSHSRIKRRMPSNSASCIRTIPLLSGSSLLTATVPTLSQIAHAARPSMVVRKGKAHLLPACACVEQGMTETAPCSVLRNERMMTGRRFQNSGNCASSGKSHQKSCRTLGAPIRRGATLGGGACSWADITRYDLDRRVESLSRPYSLPFIGWLWMRVANTVSICGIRPTTHAVWMSRLKPRKQGSQQKELAVIGELAPKFKLAPKFGEV